MGQQDTSNPVRKPGLSSATMTPRISTGTGLALLAGAIALHAVLPSALARFEPSAEAAWTPAFIPLAAEPQQAQAPGAPATVPANPPATAAATPIGITCVAGSSGTTTVLFRLWSNGYVDRRLTSSTNGLTWQGGWQPLQAQPGSAP